ncbi:MAG TPA: hypothetical protein PK006_04545 [Saprospiraceae bacterium]|nr:hypothetical protein [Saprospiraceae bacterium]
MKIIHPLILLCLIASYTLTIAQPSTGFLNSFQAFPQKNRWIAGFSSNTKTSLSYGIRVSVQAKASDYKLTKGDQFLGSRSSILLIG